MIVIPYQFDAATVDLILEGLGKLPHERVRAAIDHIHSHAAKTLQDAQAAQLAAQRAEWEQAKPKRAPRKKESA